LFYPFLIIFLILSFNIELFENLILYKKNLFLFYRVVLIVWPEFYRLIQVDLIYSFPFLFDFFSIQSFKIRLIGNWDWYFLFTFYGVITVLWPGWQVGPVESSFFFSFLVKFFEFLPSILSWLEISLYNVFSLHSIRLSWSYNLGHEFGQLIQVVFCILF